jgi:CBS domain-containing protein
MKRSVEDLMNPYPLCLSEETTIWETSRQMRDADIGAVLVTGDGQLLGIVTDRDIVVRAVAGGGDPAVTTLGEICSRQLTTIHPGDTSTEAISRMRQHTLRRLPVVDDDGRVVGIVSLGDLARESDSRWALVGISSAPANT